MASLKVIWTDSAIESLGRIFSFYNQRNGSVVYSNAIYQRIKENLALMAVYPYMYQATTLPDVRVFHCDHVKLFYRVTEQEIIIEAVCDTRQNPETFPF